MALTLGFSYLSSSVMAVCMLIDSICDANTGPESA